MKEVEWSSFDLDPISFYDGLTKVGYRSLFYTEEENNLRRLSANFHYD